MHPDNKPAALRDLSQYSEPVRELALALQTKMSKLRGLDAYGTAFAGICAHLYNKKTYINIEDCRSLYRQLALNGLAALTRARELRLLCVGLAFRYESLSGASRQMASCASPSWWATVRSICKLLGPIQASLIGC